MQLDDRQPSVGQLHGVQIETDTLMYPPTHHIDMAHRGHIIIPTTKRESRDFLADLTQAIAEEFGGWSEYDGAGGWFDDDGHRHDETHRRIVTTTTAGQTELTQFLIEWAENAKDRLGEDAVLIEIEEVDALFV